MQCIFKNYLSPVYTTLDFWYSSDKNGMCINFTHMLGLRIYKVRAQVKLAQVALLSEPYQKSSVV